LVKDFSKVRELSEIGVLIQVNASSILKFRFGKSARFIKKLFKHSLVDLIATDAHDAENYSPVMSSAVALISKKYGEQVAKKVSCTIPKMILSNQKKH
jgi:protein-tyrosine phosphatase